MFCCVTFWLPFAKFPNYLLSFIRYSTLKSWGYGSRVLRTWLKGTAYPHGYWGYDSQVLRIWLTGTAYPHGYWEYDSRVLMIWLTGNAYPHRYCIPSRVLHMVYTGCNQNYVNLRFAVCKIISDNIWSVHVFKSISNALAKTDTKNHFFFTYFKVIRDCMTKI